MTIYIYEHSCTISRGLTNQLIMLIAAIRFADKQRRGEECCGFCIGSFYKDIRDQKNVTSFNEIMDLSVLSKHFPYIRFFDYHERHSKNLSIQTEYFSLQEIICRKPCPCSIYQSENEIFEWTNGIVKLLKNYYSWDLESPQVVSVMKDFSFKIKAKLDNIKWRDAPVHLLHLRNEPDAIKWWSKQNGMSENMFEQLLNKKFIQCVNIFIPKTEQLIVITGRPENNPVLNVLHNQGYMILQCVKTYTEREILALEDLSFAENCAHDGIFIGCKRGSTFSSCLLEPRISFKKSVHLDLDNIKSTVVISEKT